MCNETRSVDPCFERTSSRAASGVKAAKAEGSRPTHTTPSVLTKHDLSTLGTNEDGGDRLGSFLLIRCNVVLRFIKTPRIMFFSLR